MNKRRLTRRLSSLNKFHRTTFHIIIHINIPLHHPARFVLRQTDQHMKPQQIRMWIGNLHTYIIFTL